MRVNASIAVAAVLLGGCKGCHDQDINTTDKDLDDVHNDIGSWLSMRALGEQPAIAFYDRTNDALGFAVGSIKDDGSATWSSEEVDSYPDDNGLNPGDVGRYASMAVAGDGVVWVAYQDTTNGTLKYATRSPDGAWTASIADIGGGARTDAGYWASIALDASANPVVAHHDKGQGTLRVARWGGSSFTGEVAYTGTDYVPADTAEEPRTASAGEFAKMAVAPDGTEYIAFYDRAWGALRLVHGGQGNWTEDLIDDNGDVGQWPDITIDGGTIWISYHDAGNQDLKLAHGTPGNWTVEFVDMGDYVGADSAVYVDIDGGQPDILYFDGANNNLNRAHKDGNAWAPAKVAGDDVAVGYHNETVKLGAKRYAACYDYTNRDIWFGPL